LDDECGYAAVYEGIAIEQNSRRKRGELFGIIFSDLRERKTGKLYSGRRKRAGTGSVSEGKITLPDCVRKRRISFP
jgi:hypothetical protein